MSFVKHILTELDNETFSSPRVAGFAALMTFVGLAIADFWVNHKFDPQNYGIGAASVIAALGAGIKFGESPAAPEKKD